MKQLYTSLLLFLVLTINASAQVILHHENFTETSTGTVAGVTASPAGSWGFTAAAPTSTLAQSSKGNYVRTNVSTGGEKTLSVAFTTLGYTNATVTWEQFRNPFKNNTPLVAPVKLYYSINGGATKVLFYTTTNTTNSTWNKANSDIPIALPAAAMGMPEVRLYWSIDFTNNTNGNGNSDAAYYAVDDITVMGTPESGTSTFSWSARPLDESPFVVSGANAATPYTVDEVSMRWTASQNTGVSFEIAKVDDKNFKAGTKSLTLVQLNASSSVGSVVQLDLGKPVEDLTFTIFDVDIATDQFIDNLTITGYNNGTPVVLTKNKVKTTSYNKLTSSTLSGVISNDNASGEGDVTITFPKAVTRVVIQYNNTSATRSGNGRQGIAIHNLNWRKVQTITILPVELASFKAAKQQAMAILNWSTASEKDNERFEIERSHDGKTFSKVGEVAGNGTSSRKLFYTFADKKPTPGINYYRLRQLDYSGTASYSKTVALNFAAPEAGAAIAQVYPTVATSQVTVAFTAAAGTTDVSIVDAAGKTVAQYQQVTDSEQVTPVQHLKTGIYFVTVNNGQVRETYRFLKQ